MQKRSRSSLSTAPQPLNGAGGISDAEHQASAAPATSNTSVLPPHKSLSQLQALESGSQIERWQESFASEATQEDEGVTTRLFRACSDSLRCILQHTDAKLVPRRERNILQRCQAFLKLWGDGHGVGDGSLDRVLDRSKNLQHMTLAILNPLCKTLLNGMKKYVMLPSKDESMRELYDRSAEIYAQTKWLLSGFHEHATDSGSDSDSDSSSGDELERGSVKSIVEDVKTYTNCLVDLSAALECPAIDPVHEDEPSQLIVEQRSAQDYHSDLIRAKFPDAKVELVQCLGETSWNRYQRMQQQRDTANAQMHAQNQPQSGVKSHAADSEFQDSGLGTSLPSVALSTSYAETVISFMTSIAGGKRIQIPLLSAEAKRGAKFECVACGRHVRATSNRDWRKHLFLDLQPYTCFYEKCAWSSKPFADRQLWSNHLELDHKLGPTWDGVECPLCLKVIESGKSAILIHFARHMEDISLAALPRDVDSDAESDDNGDNISDRTSTTDGTVVKSMTYACDLCPNKFSERESFAIHLQDYHGVNRDERDFLILEMRGSEVCSKISTEMERLFSNEYLRKDLLLRTQMYKDGFIPLQDVLGYEPMKLLSAEFKDVFHYGIPDSSIFEYRSDGGDHRIRPKLGWENWVQERTLPTISDLYIYPTLFTTREGKVVNLGQVHYKIDDSSVKEPRLRFFSVPDTRATFPTIYITRRRGFQRRSHMCMTWFQPDGTFMELHFSTPRECADIWTQIQDTCSSQESEARNGQDDSESVPRSIKLQESAVVSEHILAEPPAGQSLWPTSRDHLPKMPTEQEDSSSVQLELDEAFRERNIMASVEKESLQHSFTGPNTMLDQARDLIGNDILQADESKPQFQPPDGSGGASLHRDGAIDEEDSYVIKCICGFTEDDGATVLCEKCDKWQHIVCFYESNEHVPDVHECVDCSPREVDREAATQKQVLQREIRTRDKEMRQRRRRRGHSGRRPPASMPAFKSPKIELPKSSASTAPIRPPEAYIDFLKSVSPIQDDLTPNPHETSKGESNREASFRVIHNSIKHRHDTFPTLSHACTCGRLFGRLENLKRHEKTHAHTCDFPGCVETFDETERLLKHKTQHQVTPNSGIVSDLQKSSKMPNERVVGLGMTPQAPDFEQWVFKPGVSGITDAVSSISQGWQRCYNCKTVVELQDGSNHTTCRCTAQFCMVCAAPWKTCNCPWFNYDDTSAVNTASTAASSSKRTYQSQKSNRKGKSACAECRASRVKCNLGRPCTSCIKRKLPTCTYETVTDEKAEDEPPTIDLKAYAYKPVVEASAVDASRTRLQLGTHSLDTELYEDVRAALEEEDAESALETGQSSRIDGLDQRAEGPYCLPKESSEADEVHPPSPLPAQHTRMAIPRAREHVPPLLALPRHLEDLQSGYIDSIYEVERIPEIKVWETFDGKRRRTPVQSEVPAMATPRAREEVPPPLPPPRHLDELRHGYYSPRYNDDDEQHEEVAVRDNSVQSVNEDDLPTSSSHSKSNLPHFSNPWGEFVKSVRRRHAGEKNEDRSPQLEGTPYLLQRNHENAQHEYDSNVLDKLGGTKP